MRLNIISDLHNSMQWQKNFECKPDCVVYAGDMGGNFYEFVVKNNIKAFGCVGNHYYYNNNKFRVNGHVKVLETKDVVLLATTLWTDFKYSSLGYDQKMNMWIAECTMNDFRYIKNKDNRNIVSEDILREHELSKKNLQKELDKHKNKKCVVITHHAPSTKSIHKKYKNNELNSCFVNNMDDFILKNNQIKLWVHGHLHTTSNYMIGDCRVICNPFGNLFYDKRKRENKSFVSNFCLTI